MGVVKQNTITEGASRQTFVIVTITARGVSRKNNVRGFYEYGEMLDRVLRTSDVNDAM